MTYEHLMKFIAEEDGRLRSKYGEMAQGNEWHLSHVIKLMEELGELAEQVLASQSLQRKEKAKSFDKAALGEEVADVLITTLLVARDLGVDVTHALENKMAKIEARYK